MMANIIEYLPTNNLFSFKVVFLATLTSIPAGSVVFVNTLIAPALQCEWDLTTMEVTLISVAFYVGCAIGSWYWGRIADIYGRRKTLLATVSTMVYFALLSTASSSYGFHLLTRFFVGVGYASSFILSVIYNTEFTKSTDHGKAVFFYNLMYTFGCLFSIAVSYWTLNRYGWRIYTLASLSPSLVLICLMVAFLPESILYLQAQGRTTEVLELLDDISKTTKNYLPKDVVFKKTRTMERDQEGYIAVFLKHRVKICGLCFYGVPMLLNYYGLPFFVDFKLQHSGTCKLLANRTKLSVACSMLTDSDLLRTFLINLGYIPGAFIGYFIAEKLGRKILLNTTMVLLAACYFSQLICLPHILSHLLLFLASGFSLCADCFIVLYASELFPTNVRTTATGISATVWKTFSILSPLLFQHFIYLNTTVVIVLMGAWCIVGMFGLYPLPETLGKNLKDF
eukprot:TCONS_00072815-protein